MGLIGSILGGAQRVQLIQSNKTVISIDCTVSENHQRESPPTEFPLEDGNPISDNIVIKPFTLDLNGIISDTPLSLAGALLTTAVSKVAGNLGVIAAGAGTALFTALSGSKSPSVQAFAQVLALQEARKPFDVITSLRRYEKMFIKGITVPRDASTGRVLQFTLNLVQLIIVSPQSVNITVFANADLAAGQADEGQQQANSPFLQGIQAGQANTTNYLNGILGKVSK